jgi:hypothetical protein
VCDLLNARLYKKIKDNILYKSLNFVNKLKSIQRYWKSLYKLRKKGFELMIIKYSDKYLLNEILKRLNYKNNKKRYLIKFKNEILKKYMKWK